MKMSESFSAELSEDSLRTLILSGLRGKMVAPIVEEILKEVQLNVKQRIESQVREAVTKYTKSIVDVRQDYLMDRLIINIQIS